jgi:hypothetical protein
MGKPTFAAQAGLFSLVQLQLHSKQEQSSDPEDSGPSL